MRVQAIEDGFYDQVLRPKGMVFDLNMNADGTMPIRMRLVPKLDENQKPIPDEFEEEPWLDGNDNPVHADFADADEVIKGRGTFKGETYRPGWMRRVRPGTPLGIYDVFVDRDLGQTGPVGKFIRPENEALNAPRSTAPRGGYDGARQSQQHRGSG